MGLSRIVDPHKTQNGDSG